MSVKCVSSHKVHSMCVAVHEHSITVSHADVSQVWGSASSIMKFMAGTEQSPGAKGKQTMKPSDATPLPSHKPSSKPGGGHPDLREKKTEARRGKAMSPHSTPLMSIGVGFEPR